MSLLDVVDRTLCTIYFYHTTRVVRSTKYTRIYSLGEIKETGRRENEDVYVNIVCNIARCGVYQFGFVGKILKESIELDEIQLNIEYKKNKWI